MLYGGDADLEKSQNGNEDFGFGEKNIHDKDKNKVNIVRIHIYGEDAESINLLVKLIQH